VHHQLHDLLQALAVHPLSSHDYQGNALDSGWWHLFGGHLLAQAAGAAMTHSPAAQQLHSFHAYFLRLANTTDPLQYQLKTLRSGLQFSCLQVTGKQQEEDIFHAVSSFYGPQRPCDSHQPIMPDVPPPEQLESDRVMLQAYV